MIIHGFTISAFGHCAGKQLHDSRKLTRPAMSYLTSLLESHGNEFQLQIPMRGVGQIDLHWNSDHLSSGLGSLSAGGDLVSTIVIMSGINAEADQKTLAMAQTALENVCGAAGKEPPARDLLEIKDRPAVATIRWSALERKAMTLLTDMEICLAAAFLERSFKTAELGL